MLKSYFTTTIRNLQRNKLYALVNVAGLTLGLTTALVIFLMIRFERSFEQMHTHKDRIYRVVNARKNSAGQHYNAQTPYPAVQALRMDVPDLEKVTGIHYQSEALVKIGDQKFREERIIFADSHFLDVFDYGYGAQLEVQGDVARSLREPGFVALSEKLAEKYFPNENPLGQRLTLDNKLELTVGAVVRNAPDNTHLRYHMLVSYASLTPAYTNYPLDSWNFVASGYTYLLLPPNLDTAAVQQSLVAMIHKFYEEDQWSSVQYDLQALEDIHFDEVYTDGLSTVPIKRQYVMIMALVGVLIMLIACINFINLSTAIGIRKSKEVGVRKVLGALRGHLIRQFTGEALVLTVLSYVLAIALLLQGLPVINQYLQKNIDTRLAGDIYFWLFSVVLVGMVALLSGLYPAFVVSGYPPIAALKNKITTHTGSAIWLRRGLVVFQFFVAQVLIIVTLVISSQMDFIRNMPLGFSQEAIINVPLPEPDSSKQAVFYHSLQSEAGIAGMTFGIGAPNAENNSVTFFYETVHGEGENYLINMKPVDHRYQEVYGLTLLAGRWFADYELYNTGRENQFVVNEQTTKKLGCQHPEEALGKHITTGFGNQKGEIIGVVADFHLSSLHSEIMPVGFVPFPPLFYHAGIKIAGGQYSQAIEKVQQVWTSLFPNDLFQYDFMDEALARLYEEDQRTFTLFRIFSGIAIFIGCLGLFGLISFLADQKKKEVSIRKVLGASVGQIVLLFSKEFSQLVLAALLVAIPVAWYLADQWLASFAYRVGISYWVFVAGGLIASAIAFASVAWQSVTAALENPVNSLKND